MIAYLTGRLLQATETGCLVLTDSGVGYEVHLTAPALQALPQRGAEVAFYTEHVVREDGQDLYGFASFEERALFRVLISISKLGPKKAQAILSRFAPDDLTRLVHDEDLAMLTSVPGIGKKTGQQILLELRYKLDAMGAKAARPSAPKARGVFDDALAGLKNLGYSDDEAGPALRAVLEAEPDLDVAGALRATLKNMASRSR